MAYRLDAKRITRISLLLAVALVLQYVESLLPYPVPAIPIHIGLANVAVLYALKNEGRSAACIIGVLRALLFALILGRISGLLYSLAGTSLSLLGMCLVFDRKQVSLFGTSVLGAFLFNIGQLIAGFFIVGSSIFALAPWFGLLSVPCGLLTALAARYIPKL
ncbi:MAG: Gx transporter family protein [Clostridia bacterium]|nr:Gx transporter family protein [Clostridia bacterium]